MTRIVRSSPSPEELDVKVSMVDGKFDVNVNGMGAQSFNIEVVSESDQEATSKRSFSVARELFFSFLMEICKNGKWSHLNTTKFRLNFDIFVVIFTTD